MAELCVSVCAVCAHMQVHEFISKGESGGRAGTLEKMPGAVCTQTCLGFDWFPLFASSLVLPAFPLTHHSSPGLTQGRVTCSRPLPSLPSGSGPGPRGVQPGHTLPLPTGGAAAPDENVCPWRPQSLSCCLSFLHSGLWPQSQMPGFRSPTCSWVALAIPSLQGPSNPIYAGVRAVETAKKLREQA